MEEYEVDLRDYLRVIWRKKWLILGVFLAAIGVALLVSFRMPSQYEATALVRLNSLPKIDRVQLQASSLHEVLVISKSRDLLAETAKEARSLEEPPFQGLSQEELVEWLREHLKVSIPEKTSLIDFKLSGPGSSQSLVRLLEMHLRVLEGRLKEDAAENAKREIARLAGEIEVLQGQREGLLEELNQKLAEYKETLERQRDGLRRELAQIEQAKEKLGLQAGEQNATLEGIILRERFIALNTRLQQVEQELADLELKGREKFPELNTRIQALDEEIGELQVAMEKLRKLINPGSGWKPFELISRPAAPPGPVGPNREMNVAVAGVLGLFVGVLLAFFVHYLEGGGPERATSRREEPPEEGRGADAGDQI